jgi:hypothetical protein
VRHCQWNLNSLARRAAPSPSEAEPEVRPGVTDSEVRVTASGGSLRFKFQVTSRVITVSLADGPGPAAERSLTQ